MSDSYKNAFLSMNGITKQFPGVVALDDVKFDLKKGEIHALLGENGAGKSTLIKVLTGVEHRDHGSIYLEGKSISPRSPLEAQEVGISTVYQEINLCPNLSVAENIYIGREPRRNRSIDWNAMNDMARKLLAQFDLDVDVTRNLDNYSVALQQMVAIARAVDISAKVLILDEPTSSLTAVEVKKLFEIMRMLKDQGMGIIFVTHFLDQVYEVSDTITVLRNGKYIGTWSVASLPRIQLVAKMIGKEYEDLENTVSSHVLADDKSEPLLKLNHAGTHAISDVELEIHNGEVLGFSGLLGSGRSEIVRLIFGADAMDSGEIQMHGKTLTVKNTLSSIRAGIAFCPEDRKTEGIIGDLTIRENITLALQAKRGMFKSISRQEAELITDEYIKKLAIKTPSQHQKIKNLSGGNQQKVILARWLATNPELLMLDEPTRGIDIGAKTEIQKTVIKLSNDGMALIFISSELDEMLRCCNRMVILRDKKKVAELSRDEISESVIMNYIAGGDTHAKEDN